MVTRCAEASGVAKGLSTFVVLFPWYIGMFAFNLAYLTGKMINDQTIQNFWSVSPGLLREYLLATSIGLLWYLGQGILLIAGYRRLGELQVAVGSALFLGPVFIVSNLVGVLLGEWSAVSANARRRFHQSLVLLVIAVIIIQSGNYLSLR
jgi:hypothetical protein